MTLDFVLELPKYPKVASNPKIAQYGISKTMRYEVETFQPNFNNYRKSALEVDSEA